MITVNGHTFAPKASAQTLPADTTGFYKRTKRTIQFYDAGMNLFAILNRNGVFAKATRLQDGRTWYSYLPFDHILNTKSLSKDFGLAMDLSTGQDHNGFIFK